MLTPIIIGALSTGPALNLGIDFTGGTKIYFPVSRAVSSDEVVAVLKTIKLPDFKYNPPQPNQYIDSTGTVRHQVLVYTTFLNDAEQGVVINALEAKFGKAMAGLDITRVDPLIGKELLNNALLAVAIASLLMLIYIWFRFEFVSGVAAIIALLHDALLVLGVCALFGREVGATIVAAILTILGYSINDTIVVFDRIRENMKYKSKETTFVEVANDSILQTFRRSLNTSFTDGPSDYGPLYRGPEYPRVLFCPASRYHLRDLLLDLYRQPDLGGVQGLARTKTFCRQTK